MNQNLLKNNLIEELIKHTFGFNKITIFVHMNPDVDAIGSAFGLARLLKLNTYATQVKIVGIENIKDEDFNNLFNFQNEIVDDDFIKESVAFIVDTANSERVLSQKHLLAKKRVLIDHHIKTTTYTEYEFIDESAIATCQMLAEGLKNAPLLFYDTKALNYLYLGIITDSNRFMYDKVSSKTHEIAGWLIDNGVKSNELLNQLYQRDLKSVYIDVLLLKHFQIKNNIGYIVVKQEWNQEYDFKNWSDKVYLLSNLKEIKVWFIVHYDEAKNLYKVSLRSAKYPIVLVANRFSGGGHRLAAGCTLESLDQLEEFLEAINSLILEHDKNSVIN